MHRFTIACLILFAGGTITLAAHARESYFDMTETRSSELKPFTKWTRVMRDYSRDAALPPNECKKIKFQPCEALSEWHEMLDGLKGKPYREQLDGVNQWANAHPYVLDQLNWGVADYWETPFEFMAVNGDCEDYAIAKYYSLRSLGIEASKMRIMIVQDNNLGGIIHAILGAYDDGEMLILDNQSPSVIAALQIYHYRPIYGVNEGAWWAYHPKFN